VNKILDRLKGKAIGIQITDLDEEIISYLDNSDTITHYVESGVEPKVGNLLNYYTSYKYLLWNLDTNNWFLSSKSTSSIYESRICLSQEEFKKTIGMVIERPDREYIVLPYVYNYEDIERIVDYLGYELSDPGMSVEEWIKAGSKRFGKIITLEIDHSIKACSRLSFTKKDSIPLYDYLKNLSPKETKAPSLDLKTMESTLSYTKQDLTWEILQTLDHSKIYKVFIDGKECFLRRDTPYATKEVYWFLHSDILCGASCDNKLKKYSWSLKQESYLTDLYSNRGVKSITIDLGSTEKESKEIGEEVSTNLFLKIGDLLGEYEVIKSILEIYINLGYKLLKPPATINYVHEWLRDPEFVQEYGYVKYLCINRIKKTIGRRHKDSPVSKKVEPEKLLASLKSSPHVCPKEMTTGDVQPLTYKEFLALPEGQRFIVEYDKGERIEVVSKYFKGQNYLCSNNSKFGRSKMSSRDEYSQELSGWSRVWSLGKPGDGQDDFTYNRLNDCRQSVKIYLDKSTEEISDLESRTWIYIPYLDLDDATKEWLHNSDIRWGRTKDKFFHYVFDTTQYILLFNHLGDRCIYNTRNGSEYRGKIDKGECELNRARDLKDFQAFIGMGVISHYKPRLGYAYTIPETGHYDIGGVVNFYMKGSTIAVNAGDSTPYRIGVIATNPCVEIPLPETDKIDNVPVPRLLEANLWVACLRSEHYNKYQGTEVFQMRGWEKSGITSKLEMTDREWDEYIKVTEGKISYKDFYLKRKSHAIRNLSYEGYNAYKKLLTVDDIVKKESYLDKTIRRIKNMFETKTIVEGFEVVDIHPDFVSEIGKKIASRIGLSYKEKDGKFFILKGSIFPVELTVELLKDLIVDRVKGKVWGDVLKSDVYIIAVELDLIDYISFRRPKKSLLEMIK